MTPADFHDLEQGDGSGPSAADAAQRALMAALRYSEAARHDLAERSLREALAISPQDPMLLEMLAATLIELDRQAEAEQVAREALAIDPESRLARSALAAGLANQGRHSEAEAELLGALRYDPDDAELLVQYAGLLQRVGKLDKAAAVARRALQVDPESTAAHQLLAVMLVERGDERAVIHSGRAVELAPSDAQSHVALGLTMFRAGRPFRARHHLREAIRLEPTEERAQVYAEIDALCRPPGLPIYWLARVTDRLPGKQFALWGLCMLFIFVAPAVGLPPAIRIGVVVGYLVLVVYSWLAGPLMKAWVRVFPAR